MDDKALGESLKQLADAQKQTQEQLRLLLARNTEKEFSAVEGNVGSVGFQTAFAKGSTVILPVDRTAVFGANTYQAAANLDVKQIRVGWQARTQGASATSIVPIYMVATLGKEKTFTQYVHNVTIFPRVSVIASNQAVATGDITANYTMAFEAVIPLSYRFVKLALYTMTTGNVATPNALYSAALNGVFNYTSDIRIEFLGN